MRNGPGMQYPYIETNLTILLSQILIDALLEVVVSTSFFCDRAFRVVSNPGILSWQFIAHRYYKPVEPSDILAPHTSLLHLLDKTCTFCGVTLPSQRPAQWQPLLAACGKQLP